MEPSVDSTVIGTMMCSATIGIYGREPRDEILAIVEALQPTGYILLSDGGLDFSGLLVERYPAMQQIGRLTYSEDDQKHWLHIGAREEQLRAMGRELVARIHSKAPAASIFQGHNELPNKFSTAEELRDACYIDLGVVEEAHRLGKKAMVGNIAHGNFMFDAGDLSALDGITRAGDFFNYHAYTKHNTRAMRPDAPWYELRWQQFALDFESRGIYPQFILGEALHEPGWQYWLSEARLAEDWLRFLDAVKSDARLATVVAFQVGGDAKWTKYALKLRWANRMGEWNRNRGTVPVINPTEPEEVKVEFLFGFKDLADRLGAEVVGVPIEDQWGEVHTAQGGAAQTVVRQRTTQGYMETEEVPAGSGHWRPAQFFQDEGSRPKAAETAKEVIL